MPNKHQAKSPKIPKYYRSEFEGAVGKYYDLIWKATSLGMENVIRQKMFAQFPQAPTRILDLACGTASQTIAIARRYGQAEIHGIDLSNTALAIGRRKLEKHDLTAKLSQQNMEKINFSSGYFDIVTISFGLHEVPENIRPNIIKESYRVLRKSGKMIILDFDRPRSIFLRYPFKVFVKIAEPYVPSFLRQDLVKMLEDVGFNNISKNNHFNGLFQVLTANKSL